MTVCVCSVLGTPFYLMEHVQGRIFKDPSLPGLRPEERSQVYAAMNRTIATIHAVDVDAAGLADYGKHGEYVLRQVSTPPLKKAIPRSLGSLFPQKPHSERTPTDSEYDVG